MNWLPIAFKFVGLWPDILRLYHLLEPTIAEFKKVAPVAIPLAQDIWKRSEVAESENKFDVRWLQQSLNKLGIEVKVDGDYGQRTKEAVMKFQSNHGLVVDGWAGASTSAEIYLAMEELR